MMSEARYVVRAIKFTCIDESGLDYLGSDEPYWIFSARDSSGKVSTFHSRVFGNIDSGDSRNFDTNTVIWPRKGAVTGDSGPIVLSIQLYEQDQGDPADIAKKTNQVLAVGGTVSAWANLVPGLVKDQLVGLIADDLMGSKTLTIPAARLGRFLPRPGTKRTEKHRFGGNSGDLPFEVAGGPDYDLYIEIERVS